jgi:hypothetical protein
MARKANKTKDAGVNLYTPRGFRWFKTLAAARDVIAADYRAAVSVRAWRENCLQYEDYLDDSGNVVVQLEYRSEE